MAEFQKPDEKRTVVRTRDASRFRTLTSDRTSETRVPRPGSVLTSVLSFSHQLSDGHCTSELCASGLEEGDGIFEDSEASESDRAANEIDIPAHRRSILESECDSAPRVRTWSHGAMLSALLSEEGSTPDWLAGSVGGGDAGVCDDGELFQPLLEEVEGQCAEDAAHIAVRIHPDAQCQQDEGECMEVALEEWERSMGASGGSGPREQAPAAKEEPKRWRRTIRESEGDSVPRIRKWDHAAMLQPLLAEAGGAPEWLLAGSGDRSGGAEPTRQELFAPLLEEADSQCAEGTAHIVVRIHPAAHRRQDEGHYEEVTLEELARSMVARDSASPTSQEPTTEVEPRGWRRLPGWPEGSPADGDLCSGSHEAPGRGMPPPPPMAGSAAVALRRSPASASRASTASSLASSSGHLGR